MNVQISVRTADGVPIVGATVGLDGGSTVNTDANGAAVLSPSDDSFTVTASMANYSEQATTVSLDKSGIPSWDDPGTIVTGSGVQLNVEIRLGRMAPAPTVATNQKTLDNGILRIPDNVNKSAWSSYVAPLQYTFTMEDGEYAFLFAGNKQFWATTAPTMLGNPNGKGWDAFAAKPTPIEPQTQGKFTWVEWASPGGSPSAFPRYLVGLWRPRSSAVPGSAPRDAIIFYTPNTVTSRGYLSDSPPYRGNYPYALNQADDMKDRQKLAQRYIGLGLRYIFNEKFFAYQLLATARNALLIVPIQPAAQWGTLIRPQSNARLLSEAILFEHRQRLAPDADPSLDTAPARNERGGLIVRTLMAQHLPPPPLGTTVTAGFSAGMLVINKLVAAMKATGANAQASARSWTDESKDPYSAGIAEFAVSWREIWDFDGSANVLGSAGTWLGTLAGWQQAPGHLTNGVTDRIARCYHTDYTDWNAGSIGNAPIVGNPLPRNGAVPLQGSSPKAAELHGVNGSAVWFSHNYLTGHGPQDGWNEEKDPPDAPAFWKGVDPPDDIGINAHQAVPMVCFAHAAANSQLRKC